MNDSDNETKWVIDCFSPHRETETTTLTCPTWNMKPKLCRHLNPVHVLYLAGGQRSSAVDVPVKVKGGFWYAAAAETDVRRFGCRKCARCCCRLLINRPDKRAHIIQTHADSHAADHPPLPPQPPLPGRKEQRGMRQTHDSLTCADSTVCAVHTITQTCVRA